MKIDRLRRYLGEKLIKENISLLVLVWFLFLFVLKYIALRALGISSSLYYIGIETLGLWDGYWHTQIAKYGYYAPGLTLRFPLYPLLIRMISKLFFGNGIVAGVVISLVALILAVKIFYKLAREELESSRKASLAVLLMLIFPTAFYFTVVYGESLFLLLVLLSFYYFKKDKLQLAGILAGFASLVRFQGLLLFPSMLIERWVRRKKWEAKNLWLFLIPLALVPWCWYLGVKFDDPLIFIKDLSRWGEGSGQRERVITAPWMVLISYLSALFDLLGRVGGRLDLSFWVRLKEMSDFLIFIFFSVVGIGVVKFSRLSYSVYYFLSLVLMLSVGTLKGVPRFVLVLFPAFIVLARFLKKYWLLVYIVFSTIGLVVFIVLFSLRFWVA